MKGSKDIAIAILGKPKGMSGGDEDEDEKMPPLEDVMGDFISAIKSGDAKAAAKAFRAAKACADDYSEDESEE